jgi:hypothetical protein
LESLMMKKTVENLLPLLFVCAALAQCRTTLAAEAGPEEGPAPTFRTTGISPLARPMDVDIRKNADMQQGGMALLGGGLGLILGGIVLIEIDPYGRVGMAGFITTGAGIAIWTVGMFLLGFSRPVHGELPEEPPLLVAGVTADGDGFVFGCGSRF